MNNKMNYKMNYKMTNKMTNKIKDNNNRRFKNKKIKYKRNKNCKKLTKKEAMIPLKLNTKWILWCHLKTERNWDISTFIKIYTIDTVQTFWRIYNNINNFDNQIFFLMRYGISPIWNTDENINGGKWNIYINRKNVNNIWTHLSLLVVGETLKKHGKPINGIAIRPKFSQSIIKIMTSEKENKSNWYKEYNHYELNNIFNKFEGKKNNITIKFESHNDTIKRTS